ncbi:hypothetical protein IWQ61_005579 [Dispira simplex]|nr:hypothetical protein IWQ61_005579 [Dispira simplex]
MTRYEVYYFQGCGLGEVVRALLEYGGQDIQEDVQQDTILSQWQELKGPSYLLRHENEHIKQFGAEKLKEVSKHLFEKHGELLKKNGTGHYVGNHITLADISTFVFLSGFKAHNILEEDFPNKEIFTHFEVTLARVPKFKRYLDRTEARFANYQF